MKTQSRSPDRRHEHEPRPAFNALAGPAAHFLALQRTLGNRATTELLRARQPAAGLLQRQLRGRSGVVSGWQNAPLDEQMGRRILAEFARNDPSSVPLLVGNALTDLTAANRLDNTWALDTQEWGLIRENATGEVHLILGTEKGVTWNASWNHGTPLAHSHPWRTPGARREPTRSIPNASVRLDDQLLRAGGTAAMMVLPSISDFVIPADRQQTRHSVYTPYVIDPNTRTVRNPGPADANTPRLVWELTDIRLDERNPDETQRHVSGSLTATSGGNPVWTRRVRAPLKFRPIPKAPLMSALGWTKYRPLRAPGVRSLGETATDDRAPWADAALADSPGT